MVVYAQYIVGLWPLYGHCMVGLWSAYGRFMVGAWSEHDRCIYPRQGSDCYADADALMLKIRAGIFVSGRADKRYFLFAGIISFG